MPDDLPSLSPRRCPECGGYVQRVLRNANDKRRWDAENWRRYRCRNTQCTWQGLLGVSKRRRLRPGQGGALAGAGRAFRVALLALLVAGLTWGSITALQFFAGP